jgi:hypothetical protein
MFAAKNELLTRPSGGYQISRSLRFRSSASAFLSRTPNNAATSRRKFTFSVWIKRGGIGALREIFLGGLSGVNDCGAYFNSSDRIEFYQRTSGTIQGYISTNAVYRDPSAWYSLVFIYDSDNATPADRMQIWVNNVRQSVVVNNQLSTGIDSWFGTNANSYSNYIGADAGTSSYLDGYLAEVNFIDGQPLTPSSFGAYDSNGVWQPARYTGTYGNNGFYLPFSDNSSVNGTGGTSSANVTYGAGLGGWTIVNNLNAIPAGTVVSAIGVYQTSSETGDYAYIVQSNGSNSFTVVASTALFNHSGTGLEFFKLTSPYTIPGTGTFYLAKYSSGSGLNWGHDSASSTSWQYFVGTVSGTQTWSTYASAYTQPALVYRANTGLTSDSSGNVNFWQGNNISVASGTTYDSMIDSPTNYSDGGNGRGNYAVLNPLSNPNSPIFTLSNANLNYSCSASYGNASKMAVVSSFALSSGKWYCEATETSTNSAFGITSGLVSGGTSIGVNYAIIYNGGAAGSAATYSGTTPAFTTNDVIGLAFDAVALTLAIYKNGALQGTFSGIEASVSNWFFLQTINSSSSATSSIWNFGQQPFRGMYVSGSGSSFVGTGAPPSGFVALNTQNLPTPTIANGAQYMAAVTYTGNGGTQTVTTTSSNSGNNPLGTTFQPDMVWYKARSAAIGHGVEDVVRGVSKVLQTNGTFAEAAVSGITAFNSNGFTLGSDAVGNQNGTTYIGWQWKAGGTGVSNTSGSITSTVSANQSAGFSIATWTGTGATGATVGHGLNILPAMVIIKKRNVSEFWYVAHSGSGYSINYAYHLFLNTAGSISGGNDPYYLSTQISTTSNVLSLADGTANNGGNQSGTTYVAYCFASVAGYSAIGSYTGNGSADGAFVYLGFRPRFVMIKSTTLVQPWNIFDTSRDLYNVEGQYLQPSNSGAEATFATLDVTSNGFKLRTSGAHANSSGDLLIYAAFAENPFKYSRAR